MNNKNINRLWLVLPLMLVATLVLFGMANDQVNAAEAFKSTLITDLKVFSPGADDWEVTDTLNVGTKTYTDRNFFVQSIPEAYIGCEYLRPACNSKNYLREPLAQFKVTADCELYIAYDQRVVTKPAWFVNGGWESTGDTLVDTATNPKVTYDIFKKKYVANSEVVLGPNGQSGGCIQYVIFAKGPNWRPDSAKVAAVEVPVVVTWDGILAMKDEWYGTQDAIDVADNVLAYQYNTGGWYKNIDMSVKMSVAQRRIIAMDKANEMQSTIDNGATTTQIRFLARVYAATKQERFKEGFEKGMKFLFDAQYDNGGWPQYYPKFGQEYFKHITYNDDAMVRVMVLLRDVYNGNDVFGFAADTLKSQAKQAFDKGIDCMLKTQVKQNGKLTVWGAQHDEKTLAPTDARAYEKASLCSAESAGIVKLLMSIENPSAEIINAIQSAVAWFDESQIIGKELKQIPNPALAKGYDRVIVDKAGAPALWARFYELNTNRPIFCGRDGIIKYNMAEIEHERRIGYSWYNYSGALLLSQNYLEWQKKWAPDQNVLKK